MIHGRTCVDSAECSGVSMIDGTCALVEWACLVSCIAVSRLYCCKAGVAWDQA
jgi:hypothetical protein